MSNSAREISLDILLDIEKNKVYSNIAINTGLKKNQFMDKQDRAFINRICDGVVENKIKLDYIINQFSKTKVNKCKPLIRCVLRMGVYQIFYMDSVNDMSACNESVKLAEKRGFKNLKGFVNGVLRNICREKENIAFPDKNKDNLKYLSVNYSVPEELIEILKEEYTLQDIEIILEAQNQVKGTTIRVNTEKISVEDYEKLLINAGIKVDKGIYNKESLIISDYDYIRKVPGFFDGYFAVQDESSQLAVKAAGIKSGDFVLDICAAPGGKSILSAMLTGKNGKVISRDLTPEKTELIEENAERMGLSNIQVEVCDATVLDQEMYEKADVVIADLPCSGIGIMGRKKDIKYNVDRNKIEELSTLQRQILQNAVTYVKPGGRLIFSTCTICRKENLENALWVNNLDNFDFDLDMKDMPEELKERSKKGYITLVQGKDSSDGFFISAFTKKQKSE